MYKKMYHCLDSLKMNFQQNRIKNLFQERLNYFFGEKGNVNYIRSRIMEREF